QRLRDPAPLRQLAEGQGLRRGGSGDGRDERLVGGFELAGEEALDHGQREALLLELLDPLQPFDVGLAVPRDAALPPRRVEQALALVEADRVHGHAGGPGQLFDPVLHEWLLTGYRRRPFVPERPHLSPGTRPFVPEWRISGA